MKILVLESVVWSFMLQQRPDLMLTWSPEHVPLTISGLDHHVSTADCYTGSHLHLLAKTGVEHALQFPWLDQKLMDLTVMLWFKVVLRELSFMASHSTLGIKGVRAFPRTWLSNIGRTSHVRRATFEFTNNTSITFCAGPASDYLQLIIWLLISLCVPHGTVCSWVGGGGTE